MICCERQARPTLSAGIEVETVAATSARLDHVAGLVSILDNGGREIGSVSRRIAVGPSDFDPLGHST